MPSSAENALPSSDRRHTHTRGGSTEDGTSLLRNPSTQGPSAQNPSAQNPSAQGPSTRAPSTQVPATQAPATRTLSNPSPSAEPVRIERTPTAHAESSAPRVARTAAVPSRDRALPPRTRRVLHVDVDAFLASVEQAVHPELAGKAVVIGGLPTDRNLVMSCSYPARAYGVKPGMLLPEAYRRCPHAIFRRGDSQAAKRLREALARILMRVTPVVEVASIDDFFAELTGTTRALGDAFDVAQGLRAAIRDELSLPVTMGIGTSRTLARLAGKLAKPGGIAEILPGHERAFLHGLPIEHLPGAGHVIGRMLERFGITRVGDLTLVPREVLFASFGQAGLVLHERAHGRDPEPIEATFTQDDTGAWIERPPLTIRRDSTFEPEEGRREIVEAMLAYLVERATHKLRSHRVVARSVAVRVQYVDTRPKPTDRPRESNPELEKRARLSPGSDSTDAIQRLVLATWRDLPRKRALVKRVGITLGDFARAGGHQRSFAFDEVADVSAEERGRWLQSSSFSSSSSASATSAAAMRPTPPTSPAPRSRHTSSTERSTPPARSTAASRTSEEGESAPTDARSIQASSPAPNTTSTSTRETSPSPFTQREPRESREDRQRRLDQALDAVRARHGFGRIVRGASFPLSTDHELLPDGYRLRTPSLNQ